MINQPRAGSGQQVNSASALNLADDLAVKPSRQAGDASGDQLAGLRSEAGEDLGIRVNYLVHRNIHATTWHLAVVTTQGNQTFFGLRLHGKE